MSWAALTDRAGWVHTIPWDDDRNTPAPFHSLDIMCSCFPTMESPRHAPLARQIVVHHDALWPGHNSEEEFRLH